MTANFKQAVLKPEPVEYVQNIIPVASPNAGIAYIKELLESRGSTPTKKELTPAQKDAWETLYHIITDVIIETQSYQSQFGFMDLMDHKSVHTMACVFLSAIKLERDQTMVQADRQDVDDSIFTYSTTLQ